MDLADEHGDIWNEVSILVKGIKPKSVSMECEATEVAGVTGSDDLAEARIKRKAVSRSEGRCWASWRGMTIDAL